MSGSGQQRRLWSASILHPCLAWPVLSDSKRLRGVWTRRYGYSPAKDALVGSQTANVGTVDGQFGEKAVLA